MMSRSIPASARRLIAAFDTDLTPMGYAEVSRAILASDNESLKAALLASPAYRALQDARQIPDIRLAAHFPSARLYCRRRRARRLLVGFTGRAFRLMMPLSILLQSLPADTDLLTLLDPDHNQFRSGTFDGRTGLSELPDALAPIMGRYREVIALGVSSGGLPAIRFGILAGLPRAISVGGRRIDDTLRILKGTAPKHAHDPICDCNRRTRCQTILLHPELHADDSETVRSVAASIDSLTIPLRGSGDHLLMWTLYGMGRLEGFLDLFLDSRAPPERLAAFFRDLPPAPLATASPWA
ncbi:hypothetical protein E7811_13270 [Aliigemmobacter aestuarii]|uniref:Alpha/beta hydrolase n=2 Tax=Aliigemmobacter aestuarii TaxID=1445661 RepID=A0A4S3MLJ7_9RHOB|nr:hypothetical protein E7811_13270 [Gemmobacter aestuarii]